MRRVLESEIENDFEKNYAWRDDQRHHFNPNRKKGSVLGYLLRFETAIACIKRYSPGKKIGDFASAHCNFSLALAEDGFDVTAVDIKPEFLNYAKKKYTHGNFKTVTANIIEYRSPEKFDCILLGEIIEHVAFPDQLLKSAAQNLKPGGTVVITTPNGNEFGQPLPTYKQVTNLSELIPRQFHWGDHLFLYTEEELKELLKDQGFEPIECIKLNSSYVSQIKAIRYILPIRFLKWLDGKTRYWKKGDKESTNTLIMVARLQTANT